MTIFNSSTVISYFCQKISQMYFSFVWNFTVQYISCCETMIIQKFDCLRGVTVLFSQTIFSMFKRQREGEGGCVCVFENGLISVSLNIKLCRECSSPAR